MRPAEESNIVPGEVEGGGSVPSGEESLMEGAEAGIGFFPWVWWRDGSGRDGIYWGGGGTGRGGRASAGVVEGRVEEGGHLLG